MCYALTMVDITSRLPITFGIWWLNHCKVSFNVPTMCWFYQSKIGIPCKMSGGLIGCFRENICYLNSGATVTVYGQSMMYTKEHMICLHAVYIHEEVGRIPSFCLTDLSDIREYIYLTYSVYDCTIRCTSSAVYWNVHLALRQ